MKKIELRDQTDLVGTETIRSLFLKRLRDGVYWEQLGSRGQDFKEYFQQDGRNVNTLPTRIEGLVQEVFWELIVQGVLVPGRPGGMDSLPWFHLTEYGKKVINEEKYSPHDPTGYLIEFKKSVIKNDDVVLSFVEESLRCFEANCLRASAMMLGIASERIFKNFCCVFLKSLNDQLDQKKFGKLMNQSNPSMKAMLQFVLNKFQALRNQGFKFLKEDVDTSFLSICNLIRIQRNDIGHPKKVVDTIDREQVFMYLRLLPKYISTVQSTERAIRRRKI